MDLAEKGNSFSVSQTTSALAEEMETEEESKYSFLKDEESFEKQIIFFFGQAVGKTKG